MPFVVELSVQMILVVDMISQHSRGEVALHCKRLPVWKKPGTF